MGHTEAPPTPPRQDTRRTSPEKLEKLRELAGRMREAAARGDALSLVMSDGGSLTVWAQRIDAILDGEF